ncbi:MAG: lysophospholipid acyltransferase family protein [Andreesenia angusta]|nr:lysophospholipid acyltransferase family protein [Andreesenia angusta]
MRSIIWILEFIISLLFTLPFLIKAKSIKKKKGKTEAAEYAYKITKKWVSSKLKLAGADIKIEGLDKIPQNEKIVFIANHQSDFDIALLMNYIPGPKGFVAKIEMENLPIISSWMKIMGCVFIDRKSARKSVESIVEATNNVKKGINMVVFPEGSRSKGKPVSDFKLGSFRIALKSKAIIVPITIDGSYKLLEENMRIRPAKVKIKIHNPIDTKELTKEEKENINNIVREEILSAM